MNVKQLGSIDEQYICFAISPENSIRPAQLEITKLRSGEWFVNRLIVPQDRRGQGLAKALLSALTAWADKESQKLILIINAYGDLNKEQLRALYERFGFREIGKIQCRQPKVSADINNLTLIRENVKNRTNTLC